MTRRVVYQRVQAVVVFPSVGHSVVVRIRVTRVRSYGDFITVAQAVLIVVIEQRFNLGGCIGVMPPFDHGIEHG